MAKSYAQIQKQIAKLQKEAEALKAKEVSGVVARIKEAIAHYGLTAADLGLAASASRTTGPQRAASKARANSESAPSRPARAVKYADATGQTWSGVGKRPTWFKNALAAGTPLEDLLAKKPD